MKDSRMTIWVMVVVLVIAVGQGFGLTQYNDGGTHDISTTINDDVWVDWNDPNTWSNCSNIYLSSSGLVY